jgi:enoyl-CoA hydratase/carnithine racemase
MTFETLTLEVSDAIAVVTLNRPQTINALNKTMIAELETVFAELDKDETARVLILTGAGEKGFCSGLDMKESAATLFEASPEDIYRAQSRAARLYCRMRAIPQPVIAAVHGSASGAGFSFAMAADIRIITPDARFNAAYINIGLGGADLASSYFLPRQIGAGRANEFLYTGEFMSAAEAMQLGFASRMVPREELLESALEMGRKLTAKSPLGLKMTKEAINLNLGVASLEQALQVENRNQAFMITALKAGFSDS